jgi:hypothetical protein
LNAIRLNSNESSLGGRHGSGGGWDEQQRRAQSGFSQSLGPTKNRPKFGEIFEGLFAIAYCRSEIIIIFCEVNNFLKKRKKERKITIDAKFCLYFPNMNLPRIGQTIVCVLLIYISCTFYKGWDGTPGKPLPSPLSPLLSSLPSVRIALWSSLSSLTSLPLL